MTTDTVQLRPILEEDVDRVSSFLHERLNRRLSSATWRSVLAPPWQSAAPNRGFQLVQDGHVIGVYAAVYSQREVEGATIRFCNLAAFCVLEEYRTHSLRLVRALLRQKGYEFTDLSPSGNVVALNERLGFIRLDTSTRLTPNLPAIARRGVTISGDPAVIEAVLTGVDAALYRDHRHAAAARHLVVVSADGEYAYLVFRKDRRKRVAVFATPLYAGGSRSLLRAAWPQVASHLLLTHALAVTLAEPRILGFTPRLGMTLSSPRARMFRGGIVSADQVDYLYSELTLIEW